MVGFVLFMLGAHIINPEPEGVGLQGKEIFMFACFPIGVVLGLLLAWKWELIGGVMTIASLIILHTIAGFEAEFNLLIHGMAVPAIFFILASVMSKKTPQQLNMI